MLTSSCTRNEQNLEPGVSLELAQRRAATISAVNYRLHFQIPADKDKAIPASVVVSFNLSDAGSPLQLDFRERRENINSVVVNGTKSAFRFLTEHIEIPVSELSVGGNKISINFTAGDMSLNRNPGYLYTIFVPDRARTVFPLFDQPDLKATYDLTLEMPAKWRAISAAPVEEVVEHNGIKEIRFETSDLISSYHFSFVAGEFEEITRTMSGRTMTMLHRETDEDRIARNLEAIFKLHVSAIERLERYTNIEFPFKKLDFVAIPALQFAGMEHVGAIQYRASSLFLDQAPPIARLLGRAALIAHETSHMWFGNLVTMEWFNDVWTKEVFANFMAAKIVNPDFPDINHDLRSLVQFYSSAYCVDRTEGANAIRQDLSNLDEAGQLYGAIIYSKAPVMMRQLESLIGAEEFQDGIREYLHAFAFENATWPDLIDILDAKTGVDLNSWSHTWVSTAGRPTFSTMATYSHGNISSYNILQEDTTGQNRVWPQRFTISTSLDESPVQIEVRAEQTITTMAELSGHPATEPLIFNADGYGYGLFPAKIEIFDRWEELTDVEKGSVLINLYENILENRVAGAGQYLDELQRVIRTEKNQLLLNLALGQANRIYWSLLPEQQRTSIAPRWEEALWQTMLSTEASSEKKIFFDAYRDIALSKPGINRLLDAWSGELVVDGLKLSDDDFIRLAEILAIKKPQAAREIVESQVDAIKNPDKKRRFEFIAPSLSPDIEIRDAFFASLAKAENRETESWVGDALGNLHHPLRINESEKYILPSLDLLEEIQHSGDIFFPSLWLSATLRNHRSEYAVNTVRQFLGERPEYSKQLRMKILQSADMLFRANQILHPERRGRESIH